MMSLDFFVEHGNKSLPRMARMETMKHVSSAFSAVRVCLTGWNRLQTFQSPLNGFNLFQYQFARTFLAAAEVRRFRDV